MPNKWPDRKGAEEYRREAARVRALADASYLTDVRNDLFAIAQDYEIMAQRRDHAMQRDEAGAGEPSVSRTHPRRSSGRAR